MPLPPCFRLTTCAALTLIVTLAAHAQPTTLDSLSVPEGFSVSRAAGPELSSYPMFMEFDDQGRLFIAESTGKDLSGQEMAAAPECLILRLEDENGDGVFDRRTVFAESLSLPMGVLWHQDALYVASPPDFVRFTDTDNDGVSDTREVLLTGWNVYNTASLHGPFLGPDGRLYLTHGRHGYAITTKEGVRLEGLASRIWRCQPDGTQLERFAGGGFDNPVELIFTPGAEIIGTMTYFTDPKLGQRDGLMHWVWGGVYPKPHPSVAEFIRTGDLMPVVSKYARIAPSGMARYRSDAFGADYTGDLFSAQFNPHRVQRHRLLRDGATFRTEDEDFLTSTNPDFYPTDVLEDADGSLLVSDTGAWYVDACPISRVAKPEVRGGIYRVTRENAPAPADPWGKEIDWAALDMADRVAYLGDPRFRVRDRALQAVIASGRDALPVIASQLQSSRNVALKRHALAALYQIDSQGDPTPFIRALKDGALEVRLTAARFLGDLGNAAALPALIQRLSAEHAAERREMATALGRIGDPAAAEALLSAAAGVADRFEEHAFIFALIELDNREALANAVTSAHAWGTRKAALIARDQLKDDTLAVAHALPFLDSNDAGLRHAGLWVAGHHADWAPEILAFVEARLPTVSEDEAERESLHDTLAAYSGTDTGIAFIARLLEGDATNTAAKGLLLECVAKQGGADFPDAWHKALRKTLESGDIGLRRHTLSVIRANSLEGFDDLLAVLVDDTSEESTLRYAALTILLQDDPQLAGERLAFALDGLRPGADPEVRRAAAVTLGAADLNADTLVRLVEDYLPAADSLTVATILSSIEGSEDATVGTVLVDTLLTQPETLRLISQVQLETVLRTFPEVVQRAAVELKAKASQGAEAAIAKFLELEPRIGTGDVGRGRQIFFSKEAQCGVCHAVGTEGGHLGPDLTTIGLVRSGHDLLESILFPNASMVPDYVPHIVDLDWETLTGIIKEESPVSVSLATAVDEARHIPRDEIRAMKPSTVSMMPEGLDAAITDQQLIDLVTFLQSLNNNHFLLPEPAAK